MDNMISLSGDCTRAYIVVGSRRVEVSIEDDHIVLRGDVAMGIMRAPLWPQERIQEASDAAARIKEHFESAKRHN